MPRHQPEPQDNGYRLSVPDRNVVGQVLYRFFVDGHLNKTDFNALHHSILSAPTTNPDPAEDD